MGHIRQTASSKALLRFAGVLIVVFVSFTATGCFHNETEEAIKRTTEILERSIAELESEAYNSRQVVDRALRDLPEQVNQTIRTEVTNLAANTIAATGEEFSCRVDFLRERTLEEFRRILAIHKTGVYTPRTPTFCSLTPDSIDLNLDEQRRNKIDISGYNFDIAFPLQVFAVQHGGDLVDISNRLKTGTHYHRVLDLSTKPDFTLDEKTDYLLFKWNGANYSEAPVLAKKPPPCKEENKMITPKVAEYKPPHIPPGDKEFSGNGPEVVMQAWLVPQSDILYAQVYMRARETGGDWTTASGTSGLLPIYSAEPGYRISTVPPPLYDPPRTYTDETWEEDINPGAGTVVKWYNSFGDIYGEDAGEATRVRVTFNNIVIGVTPTRDCS